MEYGDDPNVYTHFQYSLRRNIDGKPNLISSHAQVSITIMSVNDPPIGVDDEVSVSWTSDYNGPIIDREDLKRMDVSRTKVVKLDGFDVDINFASPQLYYEVS